MPCLVSHKTIPAAFCVPTYPLFASVFSASVKSFLLFFGLAHFDATLHDSMSFGLFVILSYHGLAVGLSLGPDQRSVGTSVSGLGLLLRTSSSQDKAGNMS